MGRGPLDRRRSVLKTAKQGALDAPAAAVPGRQAASAEQVALAEARAEMERLRSTIAEQAVALHLDVGKRDGLECGPGPAGCRRPNQGGAAGLVEYATAHGWSVRQAAGALGLDHVRVLRWQSWQAAGRLDDLRPGPDEALHALLDWERKAIVKLSEEWGQIDRAHRKLPTAARAWAGSTSANPACCGFWRPRASPARAAGARAAGETSVSRVGQVGAELHLDLRLHALHRGVTVCAGDHGSGLP